MTAGDRALGDENVAGLVKELTDQLASIAQSFGTRADVLLSAPPASSGSAGVAIHPVHMARSLLAQRAARLDHFPADLFHEPAWDMLLALYIAHEEGRIMNVKSLVSSAHAPVTTSQRWIDHLFKLGLVDRVVDPIDRRRIEVSLSQSGYRALETYLAALGASRR